MHRISSIRNRRGRIVGLTCRVGRAVFGTISTIEDIIRTGDSTVFHDGVVCGLSGLASRLDELSLQSASG